MASPATATIAVNKMMNIPDAMSTGAATGMAIPDGSLERSGQKRSTGPATLKMAEQVAKSLIEDQMAAASPVPSTVEALMPGSNWNNMDEEEEHMHEENSVGKLVAGETDEDDFDVGGLDSNELKVLQGKILEALQSRGEQSAAMQGISLDSTSAGKAGEPSPPSMAAQAGSAGTPSPVDAGRAAEGGRTAPGIAGGHDNDIKPNPTAKSSTENDNITIRKSRKTTGTTTTATPNTKAAITQLTQEVEKHKQNLYTTNEIAMQ